MRPLRLLLGGLLLGLVLGLPALAEGPPVAEGATRKPDLVDLSVADPTLRLDIRYATPHNFMGRVLYPEARAYLERPVAADLSAANRELRERGLVLVIFDAYRPWRVTKAMWDFAPEAWREGGYVADPAQGSRHNRGATVDLTLGRLSDGTLLPMPSGYDDFTTAAHADSRAGTDEERRNRDLLIRVMGRHGFRVLPQEWWHFDHRSWRQWPILDLPFGDLQGSTPP